MPRSNTAKPLIVTLSVFLMSCQATAIPEPAVLERVDDETVTQLKEIVAAAMGNPGITFGAMDLAHSSAIPVLPPPPTALEGQSTVMPTYFDLAIEDGLCLVIERSSGQAFEADGVPCKPASG